jgi:hypothetical protein
MHTFRSISAPHFVRRIACLALLLWLSATCHAQQQGQAAEGSLELVGQGGRYKQIRPGRRISLIGPPGVAAIKGKLVTVTDTIFLRPDNIRYKTLRKVAISDVRAVGMRRLGWQVFGFYMLLQATITSTALVIAMLSFPGFVGGMSFLVIVQILYLFGLVTLCFEIAYRRYRMPRFQIKRKGPKV